MARNNNPVYRRIYEDLRKRIGSGSVLPGMALDSESTLARQWQCSRHSVRRALLLLSERGMLQQRAGRGWFVTSKAGGHGKTRRIVCLGLSPSAALQTLAQDNGYHLQSWNTSGRQRADMYADICHDEHIVAVIATEMQQAPRDFIRELRRQQKHIVLIGLSKAADCDVVSLDFFNASKHIVELAHKQGHQHIAFFGRHLHQDIAPFRRRLDGYQFACQQLGIPACAWVLPREIYTSDATADWYRQRLHQHPQISACLIDANATAQCLQALHSVKSIPQQLAVAGYGNGRLTYKQSLPVQAFDAIYEPWEELHDIAVHRLLARLQGDQSRPSHTLIPCDFIKGDTGLF